MPSRSLEKNSKHKLQAPETNSPREHHRSWGTNPNLETIELQRPAPETTSHREHHSSRDQYNSKEHLVPGTCSSIETNKVHETISSRETAELTRPQTPQRPQSLRDQQPAGACFAPVRVVLSVGSTFLFGQHGPGAWEVCKLSTSLSFMFLCRFYKIGRPPRREALRWSVGLSLGGSRAPFGGPCSAKRRRPSLVIGSRRSRGDPGTLDMQL